MIKGMTGFGYAEISAKGAKGVIEIRSVNHRYLDVSYFLPLGFASIENRMNRIVKRKIERGRVTISFKIISKPKQHARFDRDMAKMYLRQSKALKRELALTGNLSLSEVVQLPGVIVTKEVALAVDALWSMIEKGINCALESVVSMRKREGISLSLDIKDKLRRMLLQIKKIQARNKVIAKNKKEASNTEEFLSFQKSNDVNEEISRLIHHVQEFKKLLKTNGAIGKKLDFIAQEMQRETNTIGSKIQDKIVSNAVIALKTKIEKIREQSQNIE